MEKLAPCFLPPELEVEEEPPPSHFLSASCSLDLQIDAVKSDFLQSSSVETTDKLHDQPRDIYQESLINLQIIYQEIKVLKTKVEGEQQQLIYQNILPDRDPL